MAVDAGRWPAETSEMSELIRRHDWRATPLGPIEGWPVSLRSLLDTLLDAPLPMCVLWGENGLQLYNDAHARLIGAHHPAALGTPVAVTWGPVWPELIEARERNEPSHACLLRNHRLSSDGTSDRKSVV